MMMMIYIYIYIYIYISESWLEWDSNPRPRAYRAHDLTSELSDRTMRCA